jgi:excisionase family DNA binding protein
MFHHTKPRYTINDLLDLLSVGRATLYAAINDGSLKTHKIGKRRFACPEDVDAYVQLGKQEG